ncbi:NUDIX hydrolase [Kytococcus schroeteri]|uniref:CoA pyrophosphatase n=2 Tax=Kytococcus TaxID=57499 RepID=A0A2I1PC50_9MICO|nr:CoA pyrophosphatase [Kytococcus schroeteri]PKZ42205.1 CoA pyrophosphatase [Kytococcus schroeteri]
MSPSEADRSWVFDEPAAGDPLQVPRWLAGLQARVDAAPMERLARPLATPPAQGVPARRDAAVLVLVGPEGVVLTRRGSSLAHHAGQVSFPGGGVDAGETAEQAALREGTEEVCLDPASVQMVARLPRLPVAPSFRPVTPVVGWWERPHALSVGSELEVASIHVVPLGHLVDPARRFTARLPGVGRTTPGFDVDGLFVWGYTGWLLSTVLRLGGLDRPWDPRDVRDVPDGYR